MKENELYQPLVNLALRVNDELAELDHHHLIPADTPDEQKLAEYERVATFLHDRYQLADKFIGPAETHFDVGKGAAMVMLGQLFNELRPIDKSEPGILPYKEWGPWREARGYKRQWAQDARHFANRFKDRREIWALGYRAMRSTMRDETELESDEEKKKKKLNKKSWTNGKDLAATLLRIESQLKTVVKNVAKAPDLLDDLDASGALMVTVAYKLKEISDLVIKAEDAFAEAGHSIAAEAQEINALHKERTKVRRGTDDSASVSGGQGENIEENLALVSP